MRRPRCTALKERDIKELLSSTRSVFRTDSFCIKIAKKKDCSFLTKLLISIPKKIGNAPQRNYIMVWRFAILILTTLSSLKKRMNCFVILIF